MNIYYEAMLNKNKYNFNSISYNKYVISKFKSSSYITNTIDNLKNSSLIFNIILSLLKGIFYGFLSYKIDEIIIKRLIKE